MAKFHKHIARNTRKYVGHFTKYLYKRDTIFATIGVFVFLILLGMIPINFYVLNPMKMALKDFDFNDITYAKGKKGIDNTFGDTIVIVNIGHYDRGQIAFLVEKVNNMQPKVMGLDTYFETEKDPGQDSLLRSVLLRTKNLVTVSRLGLEEKTKKIVLIKDYFDSAYSLRGFANLAADTIGTVRVYAPFEKINKKKYPHFTSAIIREFDSVVYRKLERRNKKVETINYSRRTDKYKIVEGDDIMMDNVDSSMMRNKIVLFGYVNVDPNNIEDKKFTPMNPEFAGKTKPDMNGVVVHANIISMALEGSYIKKMPKWVAWLVAILIGWLHMSLFIRYYLESHIWFHLVAKLAQVLSAIFFAYLGMWIFDKFAIKLDMKYTLYVIVLAVDIIYFYEAFAVWLHKKFKYATIFAHHHHPVEATDQHEQAEHHTRH